ncbi:MAG TPA: MerR family transcriptional regulator [Micromonospora sp.]
MTHPVGRVAELAGVTVRTLHHYDEIGLLSPSGRSPAGYRRYDEDDLNRLQQILFYRELGFPLDEIERMLDDPDADHATHLRRQHELLSARRDRLQKMITAIEFMLEARKVEIKLTPEEKFEVFGDFDPDQHAAEAERRWGGTDTYRQSAERTAGYGKQDWQRIQAEMADWSQRFGALMDAGTPAEEPAAMALAEEHRQHITRWFYDCSYKIHTGLADMYLADEKFKAYYEGIKPGMARYLHDAIHANAVHRA